MRGKRPIFSNIITFDFCDNIPCNATTPNTYNNTCKASTSNTCDNTMHKLYYPNFDYQVFLLIHAKIDEVLVGLDIVNLKDQFESTT